MISVEGRAILAARRMGQGRRCVAKRRQGSFISEDIVRTELRMIRLEFLVVVQASQLTGLQTNRLLRTRP